MTWRLAYSNRAHRQLQSLDPAITRRVLRALERLAVREHGDVLRVRGRDRTWRLRVGDWRVFFTFEFPDRTIRVLGVLHRSEAYRE